MNSPRRCGCLRCCAEKKGAPSRKPASSCLRAIRISENPKYRKPSFRECVLSEVRALFALQVNVCIHNKTLKDRNFPLAPYTRGPGLWAKKKGLGKMSKKPELLKRNSNICTNLPTPLNLPRRRLELTLRAALPGVCRRRDRRSSPHGTSHTLPCRRACNRPLSGG